MLLLGFVVATSLRPLWFNQGGLVLQIGSPLVSGWGAQPAGIASISPWWVHCRGLLPTGLHGQVNDALQVATGGSWSYGVVWFNGNRLKP